MDAQSLDFEDNRFDMVICLQNGICAFHTEKTKLVQEALRVTKSGGTAFFSSYGKKFWPHRLEWFEIQASHGLLGKIDYERSINNTIVCKDGFSSGAMDKEDFLNIAQQLSVISEITLVDNSSLFCNYAKCWKYPGSAAGLVEFTGYSNHQHYQFLPDGLICSLYCSTSFS